MRTRMAAPVLVASAAVVAWVGVAALADIEGSAHDFRDETWNDGEICIFEQLRQLQRRYRMGTELNVVLQT